MNIGRSRAKYEMPLLKKNRPIRGLANCRKNFLQKFPSYMKPS